MAEVVLADIMVVVVLREWRSFMLYGAITVESD